jgi:hypothetical protein
MYSSSPCATNPLIHANKQQRAINRLYRFALFFFIELVKFLNVLAVLGVQ